MHLQQCLLPEMEARSHSLMLNTDLVIFKWHMNIAPSICLCLVDPTFFVQQTVHILNLCISLKSLFSFYFLLTWFSFCERDTDFHIKRPEPRPENNWPQLVWLLNTLLCEVHWSMYKASTVSIRCDNYCQCSLLLLCVSWKYGSQQGAYCRLWYLIMEWKRSSRAVERPLDTLRW